MPVREEDARIASANAQLIRGTLHPGNQIVIAVHVQVVAALEARGNFRVRLSCEAKLLRRITRQRTRQRFPDVAQEHDFLEVFLEKGQEFEKFPVVVPKAVRCAAGSQVQIRDDCDLHDAPSFNPYWVNLGPLDIGAMCRQRALPARPGKLCTGYSQLSSSPHIWGPRRRLARISLNLC